MAGDVMAAAQAHCAEVGLKFSNYVERLVRANLSAEGKLPGADDVAIINRVRELVAARGLDVVREKLDELVADSVVAGGAQ